MKVPEVFEGTLVGTIDIIPVAPASNIAFQNTMTSGSDTFALKVNSSANSWKLAPGEKLGLRFKNEVTRITLEPISGSPTYQVLVH